MREHGIAGIDRAVFERRHATVKSRRKDREKRDVLYNRINCSMKIWESGRNTSRPTAIAISKESIVSTSRLGRIERIQQGETETRRTDQSGTLHHLDSQLPILRSVRVLADIQEQLHDARVMLFRPRATKVSHHPRQYKPPRHNVTRRKKKPNRRQ